MEEWKEQQFHVFFLPIYSPHLNLIEILWRKVKYEWVEYERLNSHQQLEEELERILRQFGTQYTINFKHKEVTDILM